MRCVASLLLLLASCTACEALAVTVPFSTLAKGLASVVDQPAQVVRSQNDWAALWSRHMGTRTTPRNPADMHAQALTQPFHLIKLPRIDGPVTFVLESASR
jgi:hypothetical protein